MPLAQLVRCARLWTCVAAAPNRDAPPIFRHPRLHLAFSLTGKDLKEPWGGLTGRGDSAMAKKFLPPAPSAGGHKETMMMVCGTDGFVGMWAGETVKEVDAVTGAVKKTQGPLKGLLAEVGFKEDEVYKF